MKKSITHEKLDYETEKLLILCNKTNERINDLHSFITRGFKILGVLFVIIQLGIGFILYLLTKGS